MQVSISFTELTCLIQKETGQSVRLAYKSSNEVVVSYKVSVNTRLFGPISKQLQTCVKLLSVSTDKVDFQLDAGILNGVLYLASSFLLNKLPPGLLESFANGRGTLRLSAIPQLKPVLERLEIENVWLDSTNLHLGARTK
jgi:hypothetical protein